MVQKILPTHISSELKYFETWYDGDRKPDINAYKGKITSQYLNQIENDKLKDFFVKFKSDGGKIQSNGARTSGKFSAYLKSKKNMEKFKTFILEPFEKNFDLKSWFNRIKDHKYFGVGTATIYLNRIDKNKYPVFNRKTINAFNKIKQPLNPSNLTFQNYEMVKKTQIEIGNEFSSLDNFFKIDALMHYIVAKL